METTEEENIKNACKKVMKEQKEKIEEHLKDILDECKNFFGGRETGQIEHNVFEIREHLKDEGDE